MTTPNRPQRRSRGSPRAARREMLSTLCGMPDMPSTRIMRDFAQHYRGIGRTPEERRRQIEQLSLWARTYHSELISNQWAPFGLPSQSSTLAEIRQLKMEERARAREKDDYWD